MVEWLGRVSYGSSFRLHVPKPPTKVQCIKVYARTLAKEAYEEVIIPYDRPIFYNKRTINIIKDASENVVTFRNPGPSVYAVTDELSPGAVLYARHK